MNRFKDFVFVGDGSFGSVSRATVIETGETVAIKKMKHRFASWQECVDLREVKSLKALTHPNVIKLREVFRELDVLYMVFEFCERNVFQLAKANSAPFREEQVRLVAYQVLNGLSYAHRYGFFHRDLKPENLLCNGLDHVKIADFGLAREIRSRPPYTEYVATRWYRAPEIALRALNYNSPVDVWATACILVELLVGHPLFPATSEVDLLQRFANTIGALTPQTWAEGVQIAAKANIRLPQGPPATPLCELLQKVNCSPTCQAFLASLLAWDPAKRPTAESALQHPFLAAGNSLLQGVPPSAAGAAPAISPSANNTPVSNPAAAGGAGGSEFGSELPAGQSWPAASPTSQQAGQGYSGPPPAAAAAAASVACGGLSVPLSGRLTGATTAGQPGTTTGGAGYAGPPTAYSCPPISPSVPGLSPPPPPVGQTTSGGQPLQLLPSMARVGSFTREQDGLTDTRGAQALIAPPGLPHGSQVGSSSGSQVNINSSRGFRSHGGIERINGGSNPYTNFPFSQ